MTTRAPSPTTSPVHSAAGTALPTTESTTLSAGDTVVFQNNGNTLVRIAATTAGTGTVEALNSANNEAITIASGSNLFGPYDPGVFGETVTITTATAVGTVGLYIMGTRYPNGLRNPFETTADARDAT